MPETVVSGNTGGADFKIGAQSYKTVMHSWRVVVDVPESDTTVFNDEPYESSEQGPTRAFFDVAGIMKQGAASSGPLIPAPANAALVFQASGGGTPNTISFTANFTRAEAIRTANQTGRITGSGRSTGAIIQSWFKGP